MTIKPLPVGANSNLAIFEIIISLNHDFRGFMIWATSGEGLPIGLFETKNGTRVEPSFSVGAPISTPARPLSPKNGVPRGTRTPVSGVRGRCPRPLDDGDHSAPSFNAPAQFRQDHNDHRNNF